MHTKKEWSGKNRLLITRYALCCSSFHPQVLVFCKTHVFITSGFATGVLLAVMW